MSLSLLLLSCIASLCAQNRPLHDDLVHQRDYPMSTIEISHIRHGAHSVSTTPCSTPIHINSVGYKFNASEDTLTLIAHSHSAPSIRTLFQHPLPLTVPKDTKSMILRIIDSNDHDDCYPESLVLSTDDSEYHFLCTLQSPRSNSYHCTLTALDSSKPIPVALDRPFPASKRRLSANHSMDSQAASEPLSQSQPQQQRSGRLGIHSLSAQALTVCIAVGVLIGFLSCFIAIRCVHHFVHHRPRYERAVYTLSLSLSL